jgi:hypothetical protein
LLPWSDPALVVTEMHDVVALLEEVSAKDFNDRPAISVAPRANRHCGNDLS